MKRLIDVYNESQKKFLNLVLMFSKDEDTQDSISVKFEKRPFYQNEKSTVGYKYYKPISKILNIDGGKE